MSFIKKINYIKYLILSVMMLMMLSLSIFGLEKDKNGVYLIDTKEDLIEFGEIVNGTHKEIKQDREANAILCNDIDLEGEDWEPIGFDGNSYVGIFDGNSHVIKNIKCQEKKYMGLFGVVGRGGIVKNLKLDEVKFFKFLAVDEEGLVALGGGIAGWNLGVIEGCEVGTVEAKKVCGFLGGIAGFNCNNIESCVVKYLKIDKDVKGEEEVAYVGGIAGRVAKK